MFEVLQASLDAGSWFKYLAHSWIWTKSQNIQSKPPLSKHLCGNRGIDNSLSIVTLIFPPTKHQHIPSQMSTGQAIVNIQCLLSQAPKNGIRTGGRIMRNSWAHSMILVSGVNHFLCAYTREYSAQLPRGIRHVSFWATMNMISAKQVTTTSSDAQQHTTKCAHLKVLVHASFQISPTTEAGL